MLRLGDRLIIIDEATIKKDWYPPGPPLTLGNMRELGMHHLIGYCHNDACRHQALIDVSDCPDDVEVAWFQRRAKCSKCGGKRVDVRPNWTVVPARPTKLRFD